MKQKLFLIIAMLCAVAQGAWSQLSGGGTAADRQVYSVKGCTYIERSWEDNAVKETEKTIAGYTELSGSHPDDWLGLGSGTDSEAHYYVVNGQVSYQTLNVFGEVHLILCDGATLRCTGGIKVEVANNNAKLFIYSQKKSQDGVTTRAASSSPTVTFGQPA